MPSIFLKWKKPLYYRHRPNTANTTGDGACPMLLWWYNSPATKSLERQFHACLSRPELLSSVLRTVQPCSGSVLVYTEIWNRLSIAVLLLSRIPVCVSVRGSETCFLVTNVWAINQKPAQLNIWIWAEIRNVCPCECVACASSLVESVE